MKTQPMTKTPGARRRIHHTPKPTSHSPWGSRHKSTLAIALCFILTAPAWSAILNWRGPSGTGDSGLWNSGTNWTGSNAPTSADNLYFDYNATYTSQSATVTVGSGVAAQADRLYIRLGKAQTIHLEDTATLTTGYVLVGAGAGTASSLLVTGPATGVATANFGRLYTDNGDTGQRNTVTLSGANLTVNLTSNYTSVGHRGSLIIAGGVSVDSTTATSGSFYVRSGTNGASYDNRMMISNGSVRGSLIDNSGLVQLSQNGSLAASAVSGGTMNVSVRSGARFEAEGSGIGSNVATRAFSGGTFAVGLTDPETAQRAAAATLNLNAAVQLDAGSILEMHLFGSGVGEADHIALGLSGKLNNISTGGLIKLFVDGYTLQWGDTWTLFSGTTTNITGSFNTSLIDTNVWNISNLNEAGGWKVSAIPEPGSVSLLLAGAVALLILRRKRVEY